MGDNEVTTVPETGRTPVGYGAAAAVRFLLVELPELLSIAGTVHAGMLEALAGGARRQSVCSMTCRGATPSVLQ